MGTTPNDDNCNHDDSIREKIQSEKPVSAADIFRLSSLAQSDPLAFLSMFGKPTSREVTR